MAKKKKSRVEEAAPEAVALGEELGRKFGTTRDAMMQYHSTWDDLESMVILSNRDSFNDEYRSSVNDGRLSTIAWEQAARVMAKHPTGQVRALTKKDKGKSALGDMVLWRYIIPNANAQHPHLVKLRMWVFYTSVYGAMPMLRYWRVSDQYVGPDCQLVPIRNFYPQPGKTSIEDSDWCMISTMVSVADLKEYAKDTTKTWDTEAINRVLAKVKDTSGKLNRDTTQQSLVEQERNPQSEGEKGDFAQVELITCYESGEDGHWITFCPDFDNEVVRDIPNPHKDAQIPVIMNNCLPLIDSIMGLGDFERGKSLQFAMNSIQNLYLDSMKMQLYRPIMVNASEVVASSIKLQPGAIWRTKTTPNAAIQEMNFSPQGLNTFQSTYAHLSAALQNQNGTTSTEVSSQNAADPTFGKTPEAIKMQGERQSARDSWATFFIDNSISQLYESFMNMMTTQSDAQAIFHVFDDEVEQLKEAEGMDDVVDFFDSGKAAKVTVGPGSLRKTKFTFLMDQGSTRKEDQKAALENVTQLMSVLPNLGDKLAEVGEKVDWQQLIQVFIQNSGLENWEKIVVPDDKVEEKQQERDQDPVRMLQAVNFKVEKLPPEVQQLLYVQLAQRLGMDPSQLQNLSPTPDQWKVLLDKKKVEIAQQKADQGAQVAERKQNIAEQQHLMADPAPGYAEPVDPLVAEMDQLAGFAQQQPNTPQEPVNG